MSQTGLTQQLQAPWVVVGGLELGSPGDVTHYVS